MTTDDLLKHILEKLDGLKWGEIRIIVRDGQVTQVDRTEMERLQK